MSTTMIILALMALGLGKFLKWYLTKTWSWYTCDPRTTVFPRACPSCLAPADTTFEETSTSRQTANYVLVRKLEWWKARIPYCSKCREKLQLYELIGLFAGLVCGAAVLIASPPREPIIGIIFSVLFGYPAYVIFSTIRKGVAFGWGNDKTLSMRIKKKEYFDALVKANSFKAVDALGDIPLAGNGGVWQR